MLVACTTDAVYLPTLLKDPMADYSHPDLRLDRRMEIGSGTGLLGKPRQARVTMSCLYIGDGDLDGLMDEILAFASASGWSQFPDEPFVAFNGARLWRGSKEFDGVGLGQIGVTLIPGNPIKIFLHMEFPEEF